MVESENRNEVRSILKQKLSRNSVSESEDKKSSFAEIVSTKPKLVRFKSLAIYAPNDPSISFRIDLDVLSIKNLYKNLELRSFLSLGSLFLVTKIFSVADGDRIRVTPMRIKIDWQ